MVDYNTKFKPQRVRRAADSTLNFNGFQFRHLAQLHRTNAIDEPKSSARQFQAAISDKRGDWLILGRHFKLQQHLRRGSQRGLMARQSGQAAQPA